MVDGVNVERSRAQPLRMASTRKRANIKKLVTLKHLEQVPVQRFVFRIVQGMHDPKAKRKLSDILPHSSRQRDHMPETLVPQAGLQLRDCLGLGSSKCR